ncbi:hypothetical protein CIB84_011155 [Bambusicola thoracicus]|jgi:hypothetical protein
MPSEG